MIDQRRQPGKVTVEDLLRLKRAERPPAEFWADFDRTLHAKQLAAIVEKRPWWRRQSWAKLTRWSLPLSAAAALAVAFATVGHPILMRNHGAPVQPSAEKTVSVAVAAVTAPSPQMIEVLPEVPSISIAPIDRREAPVFIAAAAPIVQPSTASISRAPSVPEQIAGLALSSDNEQTSAHFTTVAVKDSLAVPELGGLFDKAMARLDLTGSHADRANVIEPLAQVPTPREARRARLVALLSLPGYAEMDTSTTEMRTREHVASHFNDQALYDAISRLDVKGKRAAIQF